MQLGEKNWSVAFIYFLNRCWLYVVKYIQSNTVQMYNIVKMHLSCLKAALNTSYTTHQSYFNPHCISAVLWKEKNGNKRTQRTSSKTRHYMALLPEVFDENNSQVTSHIKGTYSWLVFVSMSFWTEKSLAKAMIFVPQPPQMIFFSDKYEDSFKHISGVLTFPIVSIFKGVAPLHCKKKYTLH